MSINSSKKLGKKIYLFDVIKVAILLLLAFLTIYPMYYILIISVSSGTAIAAGTISFWPKGVTLEAYKMVFKNGDIWRAYLNTILYTGVGTLINLVCSAMCAYPLSRPHFYGRRFFTFMITLTMFISGGLIPLYLVVNNLRLIDTIWAIVLPPAISTYNMIIMRTFFNTIPDSLQESAYLDGANDIHILCKIILPLSKPIMATMTLFYGVQHWNSYFSSILYLNTKTKYPVQVILRDIVIAGEFSDQGGAVSQSINVISTNYKYAVIIISMIPILCIYPLLQRHFAKGVMIGAVKG